MSRRILMWIIPIIIVSGIGVVSNWSYLSRVLGGMYELIDVLLGISGVIATGVFAAFVWLQIKQGNRELVSRNKELVWKRHSTTIEHMYKHLTSLEKYVLITNKFVQADSDNCEPELTRDEVSKIQFILNDIEMLAIEQKYLDLDMEIINEYLGNRIIPFIDTRIVSKKRHELEKGNIYKYLEEFIEQLKKIRKSA